MSQAPCATPAPWQHQMVRSVVSRDADLPLCGFPPANLNHGHLLGLSLAQDIANAFLQIDLMLDYMRFEARLEKGHTLQELVEFGGLLREVYQGFLFAFGNRTMITLSRVEHSGPSDSPHTEEIRREAKSIQDAVRDAKDILRRAIDQIICLEKEFFEQLRTRLHTTDSKRIQEALDSAREAYHITRKAVVQGSWSSIRMCEYIGQSLTHIRNRVLERNHCQ